MVPFYYARNMVVMSEPIEVRVARLEENVGFLVAEAKEAKEARKNQYGRNEDNNLTLVQLATSVKSLEEKFAGQAPTIEEFITIKHKVVGAGKLGQVVWAIGSALIGAIGGVIAFVSWFKGA